MDTELKSALDSLQGETKTIFTSLKSKYEDLEKQYSDLQRQTDALDAKGQTRHVSGAPERKSLGDLFVESDAFQAAKAANWGGRGIRVSFTESAFPSSLERKSVITDATLGVQATGTIPLVRLPGVVGLPQQSLRIRDLMTVLPITTGSMFDFATQSTRTNATSPQVEASPKAESTYLWNSASDSFRTIAHYTNVSRQALDDVPWLRPTIDGELIYGLKVKEEAEILSGVGTGVHLNGIITQSTAFDTAYLAAGRGWTRLDILRYAKLQARLAGLATYAPSAFVLNPTDMAEIELTKSGIGLYIVGNPITGAETKYIWGLPCVESDSMVPGTFLVGAFATGATLLDRMATTVDISFEHASNYTANLATILCEERIGLAVLKPEAFIHGSFSTSPA